jgi:hypothetical protein
VRRSPSIEAFSTLSSARTVVATARLSARSLRLAWRRSSSAARSLAAAAGAAACALMAATVQQIAGGRRLDHVGRIKVGDLLGEVGDLAGLYGDPRIEVGTRPLSESR